MAARRIFNEQDARRYLAAAKSAPGGLAGWARANGVDGRSLNLWRVNLGRRGVVKNKRFNPQIGSEGSEAEVEHGGGERGAEMVNAYWRIGREIVEVEQLGEVRAVYADELIERLAVRLSKEFGKRDGLEVPVADAKVLPDVRQRFASAALNSANSVVGIPTN